METTVLEPIEDGRISGEVLCLVEPVRNRPARIHVFEMTGKVGRVSEVFLRTGNEIAQNYQGNHTCNIVLSPYKNLADSDRDKLRDDLLYGLEQVKDWKNLRLISWKWGLF